MNTKLLVVATAVALSVNISSALAQQRPSSSPHQPRVVHDLGKQRVITFRGIPNEREGVRAEHSWTAKNLPGYRWKQQKLVQDT